ncbi:Asp/Glu racemase [Actinomadura darangshiensis]|uniref:Maleate isomerase n=1 Tax=Actinomadura darangshiensis TaxID=705336 RepID=A0A4R4ZYM6_9ACTN|nr:Asp/Glu racemase [Actinomadura darangshiensis]TDD64381.1 Asp/Glu racemase [Actinomadura darangshiensis]
MNHRRIGLIVPSSNTTMETEVPELLARRPGGERFTFHSSRAVLHTVDAESLRAMAGQADRCAGEVADAAVDVIAYACLIAVMAQGPRAHEEAERRMRDTASAAGCDAPVTSSAGALVRGVQRLGLSRIAIVAPYAPELTGMVVRYFAAYDIEVTAVRSLSVTDNREVGRLDPGAPLGHARELDLGRAEGVVLSACVQMPSLAAVTEAQEQLDLPVFSAATATTREILDALGLDPHVPGGGALLGGRARP